MVICLKKEIKLYFKSFFISLFCLAFFLAFGSYYLGTEIAKTSKPAEKVPYDSTPENLGIVVNINGNTSFYFLDFLEEEVNVFLENPVENALYKGYSVDYIIEGDSTLLEKVVDYFGGIELTVGDEKLNCTGLQVTEFLRKNNTKEERLQVIVSLSNRFSQEQFTEELIHLIFDNSETTLTLTDCYLFSEDLHKLFSNVKTRE